MATADEYNRHKQRHSGNRESNKKAREIHGLVIYELVSGGAKGLVGCALGAAADSGLPSEVGVKVVVLTWATGAGVG